MTSVTLKPSRGTMVRSVRPGTPYYDRSKDQGRLEASTTVVYYLYFQLPADFRGQTVSTGDLNLNLIGTGSTFSATAGRHAALGAGVTYPNMTWNTKAGALSGGTAASITAPASGKATFHLGTEMQAVASGSGWYGFRIYATASPARFLYGWQTALLPTLDLEYSDVPAPPTGLAPDGVVSLTAPTMTWHPADDATAYRVEVGTVGDAFATPLFDSGFVVPADGNVGGVSLLAAGWAGQAGGASAEVRVAQRNPTGDSDWSDVVTITRRVKNTNTITSPASTSGDPTPVHQITDTGAETMTGWQLWIRNAAGKNLWNSLERGGVFPAGVTPEKGPTVDLSAVTSVLRTFYGTDRVPSAGDPVYVETVKAWTFDMSAAGTPATDLRVSQVGPTPKVSLQWAIGAVPDEWQLSRDGVILARFDGTDYEVASEVWEYVDWTCPPNTDAEYAVQPIDGNVVGQARTASIRTEVTGVWLADPTTDRFISVANEDAVRSAAYTEGSASFTALDGTVITHTFGLQGVSGDVLGFLEDYDGRTMAEQRADLFEMKTTPERDYRMIWGDLNIPVRIGGASPTPSTLTKTTKVVYDVAWTFAQNRELPFEADL